MNDPADRSVQGSQEESEQPPFAASASLYRLPRSLIIVTVDRTTVGFSVETDRVMGLPADTDPQALGGVLLDALAASRDGVPVPAWNTPLREQMGATLKAAGYRSYRSFVRDVVSADVRRVGDTLTVTPTRNGGSTGPKRGFEYLTDAALSCSALPFEVGCAAVAALNRAVPCS